MNRTVKTRARLLGTTVLAGVSMLLAAAPASAQDAMETVTVTGYRASLQDSTNAKRASVNFSDSVFAEDIGKFPDTNIAEAFNRIPGITIVREVTGEGLQVAIRGLGVNFTKTTLNGNPIATASTGATDAQGQNREVDLNMFPVELFNKLDVTKSPTADLVEGGAAGNVDMRTMRPFDSEGLRLTYVAQASYVVKAAKPGGAATLIASNTWGPLGVLVGVVVKHNVVRTQGFETIGWTNANIPAGGAQCGTSTGCNSTGGSNWTIPGTIPAGVDIPVAGGSGNYAAGTVIDQAWLQANNPGINTGQLSNALLPRLGRPADQWGARDRVNGVVSIEFRPSEDLHFYMDTILGRTVNVEHRTDMMFQVRNSSIIPTGVTLDANGNIRTGKFYNAQMFLEDRPYTEKGDFIGINPGMDWQVNELLHIDAQANATRSHFFRDYPTVGLFTRTTTVDYNNNGPLPAFTSTIDLQSPNSWHWNGQRANIQQEKRYIYTNALRLNASYGGEEFSVKVGASWDDMYRDIRGQDNTGAWQAAVCGGNPSFYLYSPNSQPACDGINATHPAYPGFGTGASAGQTLTWQGSLVPDAALPNYLVPGGQGYAIVNWPAFRQQADYYSFAKRALYASGSNTGASAGTIDEKIMAAYAEISGKFRPAGRTLRYNLGLRWAETHQTISGLARQIADPRNAGADGIVGNGDDLADGGRYPNVNVFTSVKNVYQAFLPSLSLVYEVADDFQIRAAVSRTMTRPNPSSMLPGATFSSPSADIANVGNSSLKPYYSNNIDIGGELYTGGEGYIGFAAFRKSISGFTVTGTTNHVFADLAAYGINYSSLSDAQKQAFLNRTGCTSDSSCGSAAILFQQQVNSSGLLTVNGLEFNWVQPMDFLTQDWFGVGGFGFTFNLTVIDQRGSGAAPATAIGVAPYTYNIVTYYEKDGAMLRASYVFNKGSVASGTNQNGIPLAAIYGRDRGQLDLSASYKLSKILGEVPSDPEVTLDIQNVLNNTQGAYFQYRNLPFTYYQPGAVFLFGVRGTF